MLIAKIAIGLIKRHAFQTSQKKLTNLNQSQIISNKSQIISNNLKQKSNTFINIQLTKVQDVTRDKKPACKVLDRLYVGP